MNGATLDLEYRPALRLRVDDRLGCKTAKWIKHLECIESKKNERKRRDGDKRR